MKEERGKRREERGERQEKERERKREVKIKKKKSQTDSRRCSTRTMGKKGKRRKEKTARKGTQDISDSVKFDFIRMKDTRSYEQPRY